MADAPRGEMALYVCVAAQEEYLTAAMRTSQNSVSANFGEGEFSVSRNELARRHGTGVVNRTVREHEDGPTPPPRSARPPRSRIVSGGPGPVHAHFGPFRPAWERRGARKSPAVQEGEVRAAGPDGILLPGSEGGRSPPPPKNFSERRLAELLRIYLLGTSMNETASVCALGRMCQEQST